MISIPMKDVKPFDAYDVFKANPTSHRFAKYMLDEDSDHFSESENDFTFLRKSYLRRYLYLRTSYSGDELEVHTVFVVYMD